MTELMEKALKAIKVLPPEEQDAIAQSLLNMIGRGSVDLVEIPADHLEAIDEGLAQLDRGEMVTYEEMKATFAKYRQ